MTAPEQPLAKRVRAAHFYTEILSQQEKELLPVARRMKGLKEEIAALRVKLRTALHQRPDDFQLMKLGIDALVRAVAAQYRLSPKAKRDLADNLAATLNSIGDQLLPPDR